MMNLDSIPEAVWTKLAKAALSASKKNLNVKQSVDNLFSTTYENWSRRLGAVRDTLALKAPAGRAQTHRKDDSLGGVCFQQNNGDNEPILTWVEKLPLRSRCQFVVWRGAGMV